MSRPNGRFAVLLLGLSLSCACGGARDRAALDCPSQARVVQLTDIHYPDDECAAATGKAEAHVTAAYYRKACEQLAPAAGLPRSVSDAFVSACTPGSEAGRYVGGSVLTIQICCP